MKKFLETLLKIALLTGCTALGYYIHYNEEIYLALDEKIIPIIVGVLGAIASLVSVFKPILNKLDTSNEDLKKSMDFNNRIISENALLKTSLETAVKQINELTNEVNNLTKIVKTGFAGNQDLIKNGTVNKIYKVGEEDEN